jgi:sugar/nucleoside kinase (ribokinase family)
MLDRKREQKPLLLTAGFLALDVVFGLENTEPKFYAGGTCGNVAAGLAFLGWDVSPLARLRADAAGIVVRRDLERWGVNTRYLSLNPAARTPIVLERITRSKNGVPKHRFLWNCPDCGAYFPPYRALLRTQVELIQEKLETPHVFFTDRVSRAIVELARHFCAKGSIVCFEPSGIGDPSLFREMLKLSTILKYSAQRARGFSDSLRCHGALLEIETFGEDGLRFRMRGTFATWHSLPAHEVTIKDTAGSGDWTTVGLLSTLFKNRKSNLAAATKRDIAAALEHGQAIAALNCEFEGARGAMYQLSRTRFLEAVKMIEGKVPNTQKERKISLSHDLATSTICPSCSPRKNINQLPDGKPLELQLATRS